MIAGKFVAPKVYLFIYFLGWRNVCDCLVQLYKSDLLPDSFTNVEDFVNRDGVVSIARNFRIKKAKSDNGGV